MRRTNSASSADAVAHGMLQGPVELFASDTAPGEETSVLRGIQFALLGTAGGIITALVYEPSIGLVIGLTLLAVCAMAARAP